MSLHPFLLRLTFLASVAASGVSCHSFSCGCEDEADELLQRIPVLPGRAPSAEGPGSEERVRKQTYSIDAKSGVFSYHKSIEAKAGYLGANCGGLSREKAEKLGVEPFEGVVVHAVNAKSPAAQAGLLVDDVILNLGDEPILSVDRLEYLVEQAKPGDKGVLGIRRGDQSLTVPIVFGEQTRIESGEGIQERLETLDDRNRTGLKVAPLSADAAKIVMGSGTPPGLLVIDVLPGGPAYFGGIHVRDWIVKVRDTTVQDITDYVRAFDPIEPGDDVVFTYLRSGVEGTATVRVEANANGENGFSIPLLAKYKYQACRREFEILLGFLWNSESCYSVRERGGQQENYRSRNWGCVLDLIRYKNTSRGRGRLEFLWFIPIWWGRDEG